VLGSKQRHYAIPFFPPIAILIADTFSRWKNHYDLAWAKMAARTLFALSALFSVAIVAAPFAAAKQGLMPTGAESTAINALTFVGMIVFVFAAVRATSCSSAVYLLWAGFVCATSIFARTFETKDFGTSPVAFCASVGKIVPRDAELYDYDVALPRREGKRPIWRAQVLFYLGRKVVESDAPLSDLLKQKDAYILTTEKRLQEIPSDTYDVLAKDDNFLGHKNDVFLIRIK
jgi:hypothetical protein